LELQGCYAKLLLLALAALDFMQHPMLLLSSGRVFSMAWRAGSNKMGRMSMIQMQMDVLVFVS
jgi:hypothetical protein